MARAKAQGLPSPAPPHPGVWLTGQLLLATQNQMSWLMSSLTWAMMGVFTPQEWGSTMDQDTPSPAVNTDQV